MELPKADEYIMFPLGGVALTKGIANNVYMSFFSAHMRVINETSVQSYLLQGGNLRDINEMIHSAWSFACERASAKQITRPSDEVVKDIVRAMQELLGLETKNAKD
jgi:hypothetical protein